MGTNNLSTRNAGDVISQNDVNQYKTALTLDLVPRNSSGVPANEGGDLGSSVFRWNNARIKNVIADTVDATQADANLLVTRQLSVTDSTDANAFQLLGTTSQLRVERVSDSAVVHRFGNITVNTNGTDPGTKGLVFINQGSPYSVPAGTPGTVTGLSLTITTTGRPVMIVIGSDTSGSGLNSCVTVLDIGTDSSCVIDYYIFRGADQIISWNNSEFNGQSYRANSFIHIDPVAAGTYTYSFRAAKGSAGTSTIRNCRLTAFEL